MTALEQASFVLAALLALLFCVGPSIGLQMPELSASYVIIYSFLWLPVLARYLTRARSLGAIFEFKEDIESVKAGIQKAMPDTEQEGGESRDGR